MDYNITITNEDGTIEEVEVLDIFNVKGYENKDYILYTKNKEVDNDNVEVFVSIVEQDGEDYKLSNIDDDKEWNDVLNAIDEIGEVYG